MKKIWQGIAISAQKITETYTGNGNQAGGTVQAENAADALGSQYLEGNTTTMVIMKKWTIRLIMK